MNRKALGRGLEALIPAAPPSAPVPATPSPSREDTGHNAVPVERIHPNPYQPRTQFDAEALKELADSIRENGLLQPLLVRDAGQGEFELIAGERRFIAAKQAGLREVPVVVRTASKREMLQMALVENLQRQDLNGIEEAEAYQRLATEFGLTQEVIAERVGKSRVAVTNSLRLLSLEEEYRDMVSRGTLTAGHARALLAVTEGSARRRLANDIVKQGLSVRQAEVRAQGQRPKSARPASRRRSHPALGEWEDRLRARFGTQVRIAGGLARGRVEIHYFSEEDLERILDLSGVGSGL
jgi:ParB family transcriptional regulator, chromosome partitioning protein